jgi:hypothetical protein
MITLARRVVQAGLMHHFDQYASTLLASRSLKTLKYEESCATNTGT